MLLLTGATGMIGRAMLRRLTAARMPTRVLVRDPRRLGPDRVRVQIALGDLADPAAFRHALRNVRTVVHLAGSPRDQPRGTIEELTALATWRLLRAAEAARVQHFVFLAPLATSPHHPSRYQRAKALAAQAVASAQLPTSTARTSLVYAPGAGWLSRLERAALLLPALPYPGLTPGRSQPIWADDVADCLIALVERGPGADPAEVELAGPEEFDNRELARRALAAAGRARPIVRVPLGPLRQALKLHEMLAGPAALTTWTEVELLGINAVSKRGPHDAEALGVTPRRIAEVLRPK